MTIQQAIEKAIEGGYPKPGNFTGTYESPYTSHFLNPLFWQSLGKSMGWEKATCEHHGNCIDGRSGIHCREWEENNCIEKKWLEHWHRFIDHLAEGKDAESFFDSLDK